jgi:acyl carrier protein
VVVVREDRPGDARLVAYLVTEAGKSVTGTDLRKHLRTKVPEYMIPQHFVELEEMVLTPSGKIDRMRLPDPLRGGATSEQAYVAPRTGTEKLLAEVWQDIVGVQRAGLNDNFFEIGGHSLQLMQVIARIERKTGVRISPRVILLNTLEQAAAEIEAKRSSVEEKGVEDKERHREGIVTGRPMRQRSTASE